MSVSRPGDASWHRPRRTRVPGYGGHGCRHAVLRLPAIIEEYAAQNSNCASPGHSDNGRRRLSSYFRTLAPTPASECSRYSELSGWQFATGRGTVPAVMCHARVQRAALYS
eukprot:1319001-Rhodomonas_salina.1